MGALAILLSLAFDPFTQQLIQFVPDVVYTADPGILTTLPYADKYSLGFRRATQAVSFGDTSGSQTMVGRRSPSWAATRRDITKREVVAAVQASADFSMQSAVLYGLTNSLESVKQQTSYKCLSGNCTYPLSETLAVCSKCNDVGSSVKTSKKQDTPGVIMLDQSNLASTVANLTRFQLPNGAWIDNGDGLDPWLLMTWFGTANQSRTVSMQNLDTLIWSMTMLRANNGGVGKWPAVGIEATECAVYYCVKSYNTTIHNSTVIQSSTVINAARDPTSWQPSVASIEEHYAKLNGSFNHSIAFNNPYSAIDRSDLRLKGGYNISQAAVDGISSFFEDTFTNAAISDPNVNGFYANFGSGADGIEYVPSSINTFFQATDLNSKFETLAESMTNSIRANGDGQTSLPGEYGTNVTKFSIHWIYIILPASIVLCAVVQLLLTMWESRKIPLWKASTLATMSRGRFLGPMLDEAESVGEMESIVKQRDVHLFSHTAPGGVAALANSGMGGSGSGSAEKDGGVRVVVDEVGGGRRREDDIV